MRQGQEQQISTHLRNRSACMLGILLLIVLLGCKRSNATDALPPDSSNATPPNAAAAEPVADAAKDKPSDPKTDGTAPVAKAPTSPPVSKSRRNEALDKCDAGVNILGAPLSLFDLMDKDASDDLRKAKPLFDEAITLDPNCARAFCHRGLLYAASGHMDQARADLRRALEIDSEDFYREQLAGEAMRMSKQYRFRTRKVFASEKSKKGLEKAVEATMPFWRMAHLGAKHAIEQLGRVEVRETLKVQDLEHDCGEIAKALTVWGKVVSEQCVVPPVIAEPGSPAVEEYRNRTLLWRDIRATTAAMAADVWLAPFEAGTCRDMKRLEVAMWSVSYMSDIPEPLAVYEQMAAEQRTDEVAPAMITRLKKLLVLSMLDKANSQDAALQKMHKLARLSSPMHDPAHVPGLTILAPRKWAGVLTPKDREISEKILRTGQNMYSR